jgi:hypothetical protein
MSKSEDKKKLSEYGKEYRKLRKDAGWVVVNRYLPPELADEVLKVINKHKGQNYETWHNLPTPNNQLKG